MRNQDTFVCKALVIRWIFFAISFLWRKRDQERSVSVSFAAVRKKALSSCTLFICSSSFDVINCSGSFVILLKKIKHSTNLFVQCHLFISFLWLGFQITILFCLVRLWYIWLWQNNHVWLLCFVACLLACCLVYLLWLAANHNWNLETQIQCYSVNPLSFDVWAQCVLHVWSLDGICGYNNIITKLCVMLWYSKSYPWAKLTRKILKEKKLVFVQYSKTVGRYITLCFTSTYIIHMGFYIEVSSLRFFDEEEHKFFWWFILRFIRHFHLHCMSHTPWPSLWYQMEPQLLSLPLEKLVTYPSMCASRWSNYLMEFV